MVIIAVVRNLMVRAGADFSQLTQQMNRTQRSLNTFQRNVSRTMTKVGLALGGLAIGKGLKDASEAYDYQLEQETKLATVLKKRMSATDEMIDSVKKLTAEQQQLGIIGDEVQMSGAQQLGTFLNQTDSLKTLIPAMNNLAAQQKGYNATGQDMVNIGNMMGKVMQGQTGALRRVGITFSDAEERILKYGNEQERAAMLAKIIESNVGNMNEALLNTPKGRIMQLKNSFGDLKEEIGKAILPLRDLFVPVLQRAVNIATTLAIRLQQAFSKVAQFINLVFGKKQAQQVTTIATGTNEATNEIDDLGDAYKQAGKKAKGALVGFDEINNVTDSSSESSGSSGGGLSTDELLSEVDINTGGIMEELSTKATEMAENVRKAFTNLKNAIVENKDLIVPAIGAILGAMVGLATYAALGALIASFEKLKKAIELTWVFLMAHPAFLIVAAIGALIGILVGAYLTNDKFRESIDKIWERIKTALIPVFEKLWEVLIIVWEKIKTALTPVFENLGKVLEWLWKDVLIPISAVVKDVLAVAFDALIYVAKWLWENVLVPLGEFIINSFIPGVNELAEVIGPILKGAIDGLIKVFQFLWNSVLKPIALWLGNTFKPAFETVGDGIKTVIKGLRTTFEGLIKFITGVFTGDWKKAWDGVKTIFKGVFDSLYGIVKTPLNLIIDAVNTVIKGLNKISIDIPNIPGLPGGGTKLGVNIPSIPKLARGGIVSSSTIAQIGEAGPEMVVPLENTSFVDKLASALGSAVMGAMQVSNSSGSGSGDREIVLQLDGTKLGRAILPKLNQESERLGYKSILQI